MKHVTFHLPSFLRRVRIHGGEFDSSARAMNRVNEKGSLMTYEGAFLAQADLRIVRGSTIERKQMSTKTTFKRVALVAVAALGLSLVAVAPSNAVIAYGFAADNVTVITPTSTTTVGTAATSVVRFQGICAGAETHTPNYDLQENIGAWQVQLQSVPDLIPSYAAPTLTVQATSSTYPYVGPPVMGQAGGNATDAVNLACGASGAQIGYALVSFTPSKAGVYTFKIKGVFQAYAEAGWTVVVTAKTVGKSSAFIGTGGNSGNDTATADATLTPVSTSSTTHRARIDVASIYGTTGNDTASAADAPLVVVTTDKGLVSKTNDFFAGAKTVTTAAAVDADPSYWVFSNGDVGKASITITVGGVLLATKTVTFVGPATALVATASGATGYTGIGAGKTTTLTITATDAAVLAAQSVPGSLTATTSDSSVATVAASSNTVWVVTGVKAGTTVITVTDPAATTPAKAATYTITVKANKPTTAPTISFDKASYNVGDVITMTVGADMADSATAQLFTAALVTSAPVTTVAGATALPSTGLHAIVSGVATYKFYAPVISGSFTVTGTGGSDIDLTTLVTAPAVTKSVDIVNPGVDAATVAAEAAEAAAQDATDAALDATEAAQEAGALAQEAVDLVTALSAEVTKLIAGVRASITYLTKLVMKLAAK